jgi:hypothetical protein
VQNNQVSEIDEIRQAKIEFLEKLAALFDEYHVTAEYYTGYYGDEHILTLTIDSDHERWPVETFPSWYQRDVVTEKDIDLDTSSPDADDFRVAISQIKNRIQIEGDKQ